MTNGIIIVVVAELITVKVIIGMCHSVIVVMVVTVVMVVMVVTVVLRIEIRVVGKVMSL
jgi:hypothetical protein